MQGDKISKLEQQIKRARQLIKAARQEEKNREQKRLLDAVRRAGLTLVDVENLARERSRNEPSSDPSNQ